MDVKIKVPSQTGWVMTIWRLKTDQSSNRMYFGFPIHFCFLATDEVKLKNVPKEEEKA